MMSRKVHPVTVRNFLAHQMFPEAGVPTLEAFSDISVGHRALANSVVNAGWEKVSGNVAAGAGMESELSSEEQGRFLGALRQLQLKIGRGI